MSKVGSETSSITSPVVGQPGHHVVVARLDLGLEALAGQLGHHADAEPVHASIEVGRPGFGYSPRYEVESSGSWPQIASRGAAAILHRPGEWADLVERRGECDQPVPAHQCRRSASFPPHRTARPAVGSSRRCRSRRPASDDPAATDAADPPDDPPGTRLKSHGLWVVPYAEFSVEEPMANSSRFVLPTITAPPLRSLVTTVAS